MLIEKYDLQTLTPPCHPVTERLTAKARLIADIREIFPIPDVCLIPALVVAR